MNRTAARSSLRTALRHRREASAERRELARDLASYRSQGEVTELLDILGRHTPEDSAQARELLLARPHAA